MKLLVTCSRGMEDVSRHELESFGLKVLEEYPAKLVVEGGEREAVLLNYGARTINKVFLLLYAGEFSRDYGKIAEGLEWERFVREGQTFGVEARRIGVKGIHSEEIARVVGSAVIDRVSRQGYRPRVFLRDPDVRVYAEVNRKRLFLGIDTSGRSLHARGYRVYRHPAPLSPSFAAALLFLAGKPREVLDPFCGAGTVPIEAALMGRNVPKVWRGFAFEKLKVFEGVLDRVQEEWKMGGPGGSWAGFDISERHVRGAVENARSAGVDVRFWVGDATRSSSYTGGTVVTNPPYGRAASSRVLDRVYRGFVDAIAKSDVERLVAVTGSDFLIKYAEKAGLHREHLREVPYGGSIAFVAIYSR